MWRFATRRRHGVALASTGRPGCTQAVAITALQRGFTLAELMVALAVMAILTAIALPGFGRLILSHRLTVDADGMVTALNLARMEAIKRSGQVQFCGYRVENGADGLGRVCARHSRAIYAAGRQVSVQAQMPLGTDISFGPLNPDGHGPQVAAVRFDAQGQAYSPTGNNVPFDGPVANLGDGHHHHRWICIDHGAAVYVTDQEHCHHA